MSAASQYTCTACKNPIPVGEAVLRSVSLSRVAYHSDCYELDGIAAATVADIITRYNARVA